MLERVAADAPGLKECGKPADELEANLKKRAEEAMAGVAAQAAKWVMTMP